MIPGSWAHFPVHIEHLYIFFGNMFIQVFCPFLIRIFVIELYEFFIYFGFINSLPDTWFENIFSHSIVWLFICWCISFPLLCISFLFDVVSLVDFCFCCLCFCCQIQKIIAKTNVKEFTHIFSSRKFMISSLSFMFLLYFELIFVYDVSRNPVSFFCIWGSILKCIRIKKCIRIIPSDYKWKLPGLILWTSLSRLKIW